MAYVGIGILLVGICIWLAKIAAELHNIHGAIERANVIAKRAVLARENRQRG